MNKAPTYSYDPACEVLAEHFLGEPCKREGVQELAQHIQDAIEAFFVNANGWYVETDAQNQMRSANKGWQDFQRVMADMSAQNFAESRAMPDADPALIDLQEQLFEVEIIANLWHAKAMNDEVDDELIVQSFIGMFSNVLSCIAGNLFNRNPIAAVKLAHHIASEAAVVATANLLGAPTDGMTKSRGAVPATPGGHA